MRQALIVALLVALPSCHRTEPSAPSVASTSDSPPAAPSLGPSSPQAAPGQGGAAPVRGRVTEKLEAGIYTYLKLASASGDLWAAVPKTSTAVGSDVTIESPMPMDGFESKTLKRKFDRLVFGTLAEAGAAPGAPAKVASPHGGAGPGMGGHPRPVVPELKEKITVAKAEGPEGRTIAEVYAQKAMLKEKKVTVRGKVVKFTAGVMARNWIHLRDGTGSGKEGDLTVTTTDRAEVGDVVVAKGIVHLDKDFGAGYSYAVIVEEASLAK